MEKPSNSTGYRGVTACGDRFTARIRLFGKQRTLGTYDTAEEAAEVYDAFHEKHIANRDRYHVDGAYQDCKKGNYVGVSYSAVMDKWRARYKGAELGFFDTDVEAAIIVNCTINKLGGSKYNDIEISDIIALKKARVAKEAKLNEAADMRSIRKRPIKVKAKHGPEYKIQKQIIKYLENRGWLVRVITGSLFNFGFPDMWAAHAEYGERWIEVKNPTSFHFTSAQLKFFPQMIEKQVPIYVLCAANEENYQRLFATKSNLWIYMAGMNDGK